MDIKRLQAAGHTIREIAKLVGMSKSEVHRQLQQAPTTKTMVALYDLQIPYHDETALKIVCEYIKDNRWDYVLIGGDLMDFDFISRFNVDFLRRIQGKSFDKQYKAGKSVLTLIDDAASALNPKVEKIYLEGNHEYRTTVYIDANPQMESYVEVPVGLDLAEQGWSYKYSWSKNEIFKVGKAKFIHGNYTNQHHAKKHVDRYGCNIFYGHTHDVQCFSKVQHGEGKTIVGQSLGCLCRYDQEYMRGWPDNWQQAFGVFYFHSNGHFSYYIPRIIKGRFIAPDGRVYG